MTEIPPIEPDDEARRRADLEERARDMNFALVESLNTPEGQAARRIRDQLTIGACCPSTMRAVGAVFLYRNGAKEIAWALRRMCPKYSEQHPELPWPAAVATAEKLAERLEELMTFLAVPKGDEDG